MQVDQSCLTQQERTHRLTENLCLYCARADYFLRECPIISVLAFLDSSSVGNFIDASLVHRYHLLVSRRLKSFYISMVNGENLDCTVLYRSEPLSMQDFADVFSEKQSDVLPPHRPYDCPIDLLPVASLGGLCRPLTIYSDHKNLLHLQTAPRLNPRQAQKNRRADALSRSSDVQDQESLPQHIVPPDRLISAAPATLQHLLPGKTYDPSSSMEIFTAHPNGSHSHTSFLLIGFSGITDHRGFLFLPFLLIYSHILFSNGAMIYRIWVDTTLQSPMYLLICLLFLVNLLCTTTFMPKFLLGLAFDLYEITLIGCLVQMWFIYVIVTFESTVVLLMALDRYMAIRRPLRYHDIMTDLFLNRLILASLGRSVLLMTPIVYLGSRVRFCNSNIIHNFVCENMGLLTLACEDVSRIQAIGLMVRMVITVVDGGILLVSYLTILHTTKFVLKQSRNKALNTCSSHIMVALMIYASSVLSALIYRLKTSVAIDIQNLTSAIYFLLPATINPIIYGVRVKEIRLSLQKMFGYKREGIGPTTTQVGPNKN
ncbi:olfactory receptor 52K1-like [Hyla sarda]|uniref:olfactory receptor 52K1-like n=1 Tax=Hyla sarda TaxID=327740 RepID=UPI0024C2E1C8|nr:olfactory receptor 52K1-like [Hyla sarda]